MTVKDKDGRILNSENPTLCGIWMNAAEYEEVVETVEETAETTKDTKKK
jgi:hypothetical protein